MHIKEKTYQSGSGGYARLIYFLTFLGCITYRALCVHYIIIAAA